MDPLNFFFIVVVVILLSFFQPFLTNGELCSAVSCSNVIVEYPFRLTNQPDCCGHPDFNLSISCRSRCHLPDQTIISHLPVTSGSKPSIIPLPTYCSVLTDPCVPKRLLKGFDLSELAEISVPLRSPGWPTNYIDDILLTWEQPYCVFPPCNHCESNCQSENGDGECSRKKRGLSSGTKYAVIFIVGTPISLIAVCIIYYNIRVHCYDHRHQPNAEISSLTEEQQLADITVNGLDGSRIEAYPITLLGENLELPRPNDNTCSICLSEYQAKETIRTIPDCNHYFHANCVDEWFKLNAACPVCRNTPDHDSARLLTRSTSAFSSRPPL
ncbi:hypothetical protein Golax_019545 [Gossypium laxum]|uniref:RING-type E3 ubiquitin transferase n=1 Tax=Gossypium laxum TaxID=34288 RepID=A0A7J8Z6Y5_9ROSI|nr:hypothetical protein [Gossypium laxum]